MHACPIEQTLALLGDRWSILLVGALLAGPRRTTELVADLAPISTRTLAERLKRLEAAGILTRRSYPEAPPRVEYELTERGRVLESVLTAFHDAVATWQLPRCDNPTCSQCANGDRTHRPPPASRTEPQRRSRPPDSFDVTLL